jgi:uncharacterized protein (UPF0332 family)
MAEFEGSLVLNILNKDDYTKILFRQPIIFEYEAIYKAFTKTKTEFTSFQDLRFEQLTLTLGGYDTGFGFQYTINGISNPDKGKRTYVKNDFPSTLKQDEVVSEIGFVFFEKSKHQRQTKFRMRFVYNFLEIRPTPSRAITVEILECLKQAILTNESVFLSSAKEKVRSAKINFLKGYYRESMHNIYYAMLNATQALQAKEGLGTRFEHSKLSKNIDEALCRIQQTSTDFQKLNRDIYSKIAEEARELRELADYGIGFEAGGSEKRLAQMLSKAEELVTISDYAINKKMVTRNNRINLHYPREQEESLILSDFGEYDTDFLFQSMLIITAEFDATIFSYKLLSENSLYYTEDSENFFKGGSFGKLDNGVLKYRDKPENGFLELTRENVEKWSKIMKPNHLEFLATTKEDSIQRLNLFYKGYFFSLFVFPDGRLYFFSRIDGTHFNKQLSVSNDFENLLKKIVETEYKTSSIFSLQKEVIRKKKF